LTTNWLVRSMKITGITIAQQQTLPGLFSPSKEMSGDIEVGMTGTKDGATDLQLAVFKKRFLKLGTADSLILHHGDCIGADEQCHAIAVKVGCRIMVHPPTDDKARAYCKKGKTRVLNCKPYLKRNKDIVDDSAIMFALPKEKEEQLRSGTWSTIRYAKKTKKRLVIIWPDGTVTVFNNKQ
jgi:hypothetical protein